MPGSPPVSSSPSVVVNTDPGLDDAIALLVLAAAQQRGDLSIDSVFAVGGNVGSAQTARNALQILAAAGVGSPVLRGITTPASRSRLTAGAAGFHGSDGLGGLAKRNLITPRRPRNLGATLIDRVEGAHRPTHLLCLGPLTDLTRALECQFEVRTPREPSHRNGRCSRRSSWQHFTMGEEFNFYADPSSADQVLASPLPVELVPLDVSQAIVFDEKDLSNVHGLAASLLRRSIALHRKTSDFNGAYIHDAVAAAFLLRPELFQTITARATVRTHGEKAGCLSIQRTDEIRGPRIASVVTDLDRELTKRFILDSLSQVQARQRGRPFAKAG